MLALAAGQELDESCRVARRAAAEPGVEAWGRTELLHDVVRHGGADSSLVADLAAQARRPDATWLDRTCHAHAVAAAAGDGRGLDQVARAFAAGGIDLYAAEATARAANAHRGADNLVAATASADVVRSLRAVIGPARTPALALVEERLDPLSERERSVALLAAEGLSNKQLAERLGISHRTVANQLQAVFSKLDIHDRASLADLKGPANP